MTSPGDLIEVIHVATPDEECTLAAGQHHRVEHVGRAMSGGEYVTLVGQDVALVAAVGDRWRVVGS